MILWIWIHISIAKKVFHDLLNFTFQGRKRPHRALSMSSKWLMIRGNPSYIPLVKHRLCMKSLIRLSCIPCGLIFNYQNGLISWFYGKVDSGLLFGIKVNLVAINHWGWSSIQGYSCCKASIWLAFFAHITNNRT